MKVLLAGSTGLIGRALVLRLRRDGHEISAWVRDPERAASLLGEEVRIVAGPEGLTEGLRGAEAVVNLTGEAILPHRWTARRKRRLTASRVGVTDQIVQAIAATRSRPRVLVNASAVGFYGDRGDEPLTEASGPGSDYLAELCVRWEAAAERARELGVRVVRLRTGLVLGQGGGLLAKLEPLFGVGLGGRLGGGAQWMPFIHLHDLTELITRALVDDRYDGALNATAPDPVTNRDFTRALARALGSRPGPPAPAFALRLALGEASTALLASQRALPARATELGFRWQFPELEGALRDLLEPDVAITPLARDLAAPGPSPYLARRPARYRLAANTTLYAPREQVFAFFSRPENLGLMTPASMGFRILGHPAAMRAGATFDYVIRLGLARLGWRTSIERAEPPELFVDTQERGPYKSWWHEHAFRENGAETQMEDRVYYALPFGPLGRLAHRWFVAPTLRRIFAYRASAIRLRFGAGGRSLELGAAQPLS